MKTKTLVTGIAIVAAGILGSISARASSLSLNFSSSGGTILDTNGVGTGFTARMAGSGANITGNDPNLTLNTGGGVLQMLTSPGADINGTIGMDDATIVGVQLSTLGFAGDNDFTATAQFVNLTNQLLQPDQLCLVVGTASTNMVRAGFINFSNFHTPGTDANEGFGANTLGGFDVSPRFFGSVVGGTMNVVISRVSGTWTVTVNGVDRMPNSLADGTGTPAPPTFLDTETDLFVGVVAMDIGNDSPWFVNLNTFTVSVSGNQPPTVASQTQKVIANEGDPAVFSVTVGDNTKAPVTYQWRREGVDLPDQTNSILKLNPAAVDAGNYTAFITNSLGKATSSPAPLYVVIPKGALSLNFSSAGVGVQDTNGVGIGFPTRLPGTGTAYGGGSDTNLFLDTANGLLNITTTSSDYNGGNGMDLCESLGVQLSTLGFTGSQDLNATALYPQPFPATAQFDQFGIVVGVDTNAHTRAGSITFANKERYSENVQNVGGLPANGGGQYFGFGFDPAIPMTVLITRQSGVWHYYIDGVNWDVLSQPTFLNSATDLFAGAFAIDVVNGIHKTMSLDSFVARVFDPPGLSIAPNLHISWNVAGPVVVQSNTNLANPAGWTTVAGATNGFPVSATGSAKFYRLSF